MSPNNSRSVLLEIDDRKVASVVLNRPAVNNAYNGDFIQDMLSAIDAIDKVAGLRAVVIKGKGKHFQAGADLNWINTVRVSSPEENIRVSRNRRGRATTQSGSGADGGAGTRGLLRRRYRYYC